MDSDGFVIGSPTVFWTDKGECGVNGECLESKRLYGSDDTDLFERINGSLGYCSGNAEIRVLNQDRQAIRPLVPKCPLAESHAVLGCGSQIVLGTPAGTLTDVSVDISTHSLPDDLAKLTGDLPRLGRVPHA
jgi:hypothetical protein